MSKKIKFFKEKKCKEEIPTLPDVLIAISYNVLYSDYDKVNPSLFIKNIPTLAVLNFVVELQNKILYAISDVTTQRYMIHDMCPYLDEKARFKVGSFLKEKNPLLMSCDTSLLMIRLALSNYVPLKSDNNVLNLNDVEKERVYRAILYCNQKWTDIGCSNESVENNRVKKNHMYLAKLSMRLDLPIIEFKLYKDFRTQFYKATQFFKFCKDHPVFSTYLPFFYEDHKIKDWKEYLLYLFSFLEASLKSKYISVNSLPVSVHSFFGQFAIEIEKDVDRLNQLWEDNQGMAYLRDKFLLKVSDEIYLLLNANLLVDKMYQGMKFDFFKSIKNHNLLTKEGKKYKDYPHFNSVLGVIFSEPKMLYPFFYKSFNGVADKLIEGETFKADGMIGEPDFYMREGDTLFLFEHKDLTLSDSVKFSQNEELMKEEILKRICYDGIDSKGKQKRKGGGQLLATIDELLNNHSFDRYDSGVNQIKKICPIIVSTDSAFSSLGVNAIVIEAFDSIKKNKGYEFGEVFISSPIIMDFDTLIKLGYMFSIKKVKLWDIIYNYLLYNEFNIAPFSTYVTDNILKNHAISREEKNFLFAEFF